MLIYFLIFVAYLMYASIHTSAIIEFYEIKAARIQSNRFAYKVIASKLALLTL